MSDPNQITPDERTKLAEGVEVISRNRTGIVLTGRVTDGKVELDQATIDEIAKKFPKGDVAFVAVNAPFDPKAAEE